MEIAPEGCNEFPYGFEAAFERRGHPSLEESLGGPKGLVLPELLKFVLEDPSPMDTPITFAEGIKDTGILFRALRGMLEQEPAQSLEGLTLIP